MTSKPKLNESAFKEQLTDFLEPVTVSEELRAKTLEACRLFLLQQDAALIAGSKSVSHQNNEHLNAKGKALPFAAKAVKNKSDQSNENDKNLDHTIDHTLNNKDLDHVMFHTMHDENLEHTENDTMNEKKSFFSRYANKIRIAAGIAACLLIAWMVQDYIPRMGSPMNSTMTMSNDALSDSAENRAGEPLVTEQMNSESLEAAPNEYAGADGSLNKAEEAPMAAKAVSEPQAKMSADLISPDAVEGDQDIALAEAAAVSDETNSENDLSGQESGALMMSIYDHQPLFISWGYGSQEEVESQKPNSTQIDSAISTLISNFPDLVVYPEDMFFSYHLRSELTKDLINQSNKFSDIIGEKGVWMLPALRDGHYAFIPLSPQTDPSSLSQYNAIEILDLQRNDWQSQFFNAEELLENLKKANGNTIDTYKILDIGNGKGFIVCWNNLYESSLATEYMMPYFDSSGLYPFVDGQKYSFKEFQDAVVNLLP